MLFNAYDIEERVWTEIISKSILNEYIGAPMCGDIMQEIHDRITIKVNEKITGIMSRGIDGMTTDEERLKWKLKWKELSPFLYHNRVKAIGHNATAEEHIDYIKKLKNDREITERKVLTTGVVGWADREMETIYGKDWRKITNNPIRNILDEDYERITDLPSYWRVNQFIRSHKDEMIPLIQKPTHEYIDGIRWEILAWTVWM